MKETGLVLMLFLMGASAFRGDLAWTVFFSTIVLVLGIDLTINNLWQKYQKTLEPGDD